MRENTVKHVACWWDGVSSETPSCSNSLLPAWSPIEGDSLFYKKFLLICAVNVGAEGVFVLFFSALIFCFDLFRVIYGLFIHSR